MNAALLAAAKYNSIVINSLVKIPTKVSKYTKYVGLNFEKKCSKRNVDGNVWPLKTFGV